MKIIDINESMSIFIKKGPEIFDNSKAKDLLDRIKQDMDENPRLANDPVFNMLTASVSQINQSGLVDYSYCSSFWMVDEKASSDGFEITIEDPSDSHHRKTFKNIDELYRKYMDFREFLSEAKYVGRYFKRTAKIEGRDISFMEEDNKTLVLFATESHMLIQYEFLGEKKFEMLSPRYFEDGNFEYYGEQHYEYNDKDEMFKAIEKQLTDKKKNTL